ncbi:MAG: DUF433 domain-containing protein [Nanoarchaeota archaeon]
MITEINNYIVADTGVCDGRPVFRGTRIMAWQVLELLGAGISVEGIIKDYFPQLKKESILSLLNYASKLIEEEKYASLD